MEKEIDWADNGPIVKVEQKPISISDTLNIFKTFFEEIYEDAILNIKKQIGLNIKSETLTVELDETDKSLPKAVIKIFFTLNDILDNSTLALSLRCAYHIQNEPLKSMLKRDLESSILNKLVL